MKEKRYVTLSDYERRIIVLNLNRLRNRAIADGIDPFDVDRMLLKMARLNYELVGDYYLIAGDEETEIEPIGIWGQRHCNYLREHKHAIYSGLLIPGKLDGYLRDIDRQAETMFSQVVKQMTAQESIAEKLKANDQMAWVGAMNSIRQRATEIVNNDLIYA